MGDYSGINTTLTPFAALPSSLPGDISGVATGKQLFNGNITAMAVDIPVLGKGIVYGYSYDQLNRLVRMDAFEGLAGNTFMPLRINDYHEAVTYDPNGNIQTYLRQGDSRSTGMDELSYHYTPNTNQLNHVTDAVVTPTPADYNDIKTQSVNNYSYDQIGDLVSDVTEGVSDIKWTLYGKVRSITKTNGTLIKYSYDAGGNRISKIVTTATTGDSTYYVRDASGNVMSVYNKKGALNLFQTELHLYGSSRLGVYNVTVDVQNCSAIMGLVTTFTRGNKFFELVNQLGNALAVISDRKLQVSLDGIFVGYYLPEVVMGNDYYPFGSLMPGRKFAGGGVGYRYGFNGKENDNEVKGEGGQQDYGMRIYDTRLGRFLSVDPLTSQYPELTPYQFASNTPIWAIDIDGAEGMIAMPDEGTAKMNTIAAEKIKNFVVEKHSQGMRNVSIAEHARQMAIKQGRVDGDGITWRTKVLLYFAPWWNFAAPLSDANDGAVLMSGKNLDGSEATFGDYTAAGFGIFIPLVSGSGLKKAGNALIEGTIGVFRNGNEVRELAYKIGKYGHKGTKEYNSVLNAVKAGGNLVANSKDEALQFLKEALPGISDESGKAASKFGYRIDEVVDEARDGLKQGHQGVHINYYDKNKGIKGAILIENVVKQK